MKVNTLSSRSLIALMCLFGLTPATNAQSGQSNSWALDVQFNGAARLEQVSGLLREANAQIQSGPEANGGFVLVVDFKRCKQSRRVLEASPLIDAIKESDTQAPEAARLPKNMCSLIED